MYLIVRALRDNMSKSTFPESFGNRTFSRLEMQRVKRCRATRGVIFQTTKINVMFTSVRNVKYLANRNCSIPVS